MTMKKILAVLAAIILALFLAYGSRLISFDSLPNLFEDFFENKERKLPRIPIISEPEPEESLSYSERVEKGDYYARKGFMNFAIKEYKLAIEIDPRPIKPYQELARLSNQLLKYDEVKKYAQEILNRDPSDVEAELLLARTDYNLYQFEEAQNRISTLKEKGIESEEIIYLSALIQIALNQYQEARVILTNLKNTVPPISEDLIGKVDKILSSYEEFDFAEGAEEIYLSQLVVRSLNEVGEYELSINKLKDILNQRSDLRDGWLMLGFAYLNLQKYVFAANAFETAYELDSEWPATQYFLGLTYSELGQVDDAIIYLSYALENDFNPKIVLYQKLADLYLESGNYKKAVQAYEKVLKVDSKEIESYVRPIFIYLDHLDQPEKALKLAELAVRQFPESAMAYNLTGWSQIGINNFIEAEKNLKKALSIDPNLSAAWLNYGRLYEKLNNTEEALNSYEKSYNLDKNGSVGNLAAKRFNDLLKKESE